MKPLKYRAFCDPKAYKWTQEVVLPWESDPLGKVHRFLNLITFSVPFFKNYTTLWIKINPLGMFEAPQTTTSEMDLEYFAFNRSCNPVQDVQREQGVRSFKFARNAFKHATFDPIEPHPRSLNYKIQLLPTNIDDPVGSSAQWTLCWVL